MILLLDIVQVLLTILWWIVFIQAILSTLISFNVINTYNDAVRSFYQGLTRICEPMYRPIRRILPDFGALDFAPFVVLVILFILSGRVIPALEASLVAPPVM